MAHTARRLELLVLYRATGRGEDLAEARPADAAPRLEPGRLVLVRQVVIQGVDAKWFRSQITNGSGHPGRRCCNAYGSDMVQIVLSSRASMLQFATTVHF